MLPALINLSQAEIIAMCIKAFLIKKKGGVLCAYMANMFL